MFPSNEAITLHPILPDPTNKGAFRMYTVDSVTMAEVLVCIFQLASLSDQIYKCKRAKSFSTRPPLRQSK